MDKHKANIMIRSQPRTELIKILQNIDFASFKCHNVKNLILKKYVSIKIHYWAKKIIADPVSQSSKTVSGIMQR
jgi:hypothetical protein